MIMVTQVVLFQPAPGAPLHRKMVSGIMDCVVAHITKSKTCQRRRSEPAKGQNKDCVENDGQGNADYRRHNEARSIVRVIMMDPMHDEVEQLAQTSLRFVMEHVPVNDVFQERPDQNSENKKKQPPPEPTISSAQMPGKASSR